MGQRRDRELGMDRSITRRDFLDGMAIALGSVPLLGLPACGGDGRGPDPGAPYPPALTGLRGSHPGSFEIAHALRDGAFRGTTPEETGESYDLVVVGAGISGLAAAWFWRQRAGADARILVLDNHDDFGGHARRNEFRARGRLLIGYGGTQSIEAPGHYSAVAAGLLRDLGIDTDRFYSAFDEDLYASLGLGHGTWFDRETFGVDRLVPGKGSRPWDRWLADTPLSAAARERVARLYEAPEDWLPGRSSEEKKRTLASTSYGDFLADLAGLPPDGVALFQASTHDLYGVGIDAVPALDCWALGWPGFDAMGLEPGGGPGLSVTAQPAEGPEEPYIFHFPDGNASIARLLVRELVPGALPGSTMEDVVTARLDYGALDTDRTTTRVRLSSTVARVRHAGDGTGPVEVDYVQDGRARRVRAGACVLACWHGVIPTICPELSEARRRALRYGDKVPLVYTNVAIRSWRPFVDAGVHSVECPGGFHSGIALDFPVSLGEYSFPADPDGPMVLHCVRTPCRPGLGLSSREQHRAGRTELLGLSFADFERATREQLARALGPAGLDPARDVAAITVNRWPHGYTYEYNSLWDPEWPPGESPCEIARRPWGRIAVANADAGAYAYTDGAIDQAHRAVGELLAAG